MPSVIGSIVYASILVVLLIQALRLMRLGAQSLSAKQASPADRTGIQTIHPELLDEQGNLTSEDLWAVRLTDPAGTATPEVQQ